MNDLDTGDPGEATRETRPRRCKATFPTSQQAPCATSAGLSARAHQHLSGSCARTVRRPRTGRSGRDVHRRPTAIAATGNGVPARVRGVRR
jgi:hypothetical protein